MNGQSEVRNVRMPVAVDQDIPWLQIAMNESLPMGKPDRVGDFDHQAYDLLASGAIRLRPTSQIRAFNQFLNDVRQIGLRLHVINRDHPRVLQLSCRAGFDQERLDADAALEQTPIRDLQGHGTIELRIVGRVDPTKTPFAQDTLDLEPADAFGNWFRFTRDRGTNLDVIGTVFVARCMAQRGLVVNAWYGMFNRRPSIVE